MASRAIWAGSVTFGMVVVPVQLHMAVEGKDAVSFKQVRRSDGSQIKLKRVAAADGAEVAYADIAKAYEWGDQRVIFDDDDMASLPLSTSKQIQVEHFASSGEIDPLLYGKSYYVVPANDAAVHAYTLLAEAMGWSGKIAVAKVALRQHESVSMLRAVWVGHRPVLVLTLLAWPQEVRQIPSFIEREIKPAEAKMARELIEVMTEPFDPSAYTNDYRAAVEALAEAKVAGTLKDQQPASEVKAEAMSLMDSLAAAVAAAKEAKK